MRGQLQNLWRLARLPWTRRDRGRVLNVGGRSLDGARNRVDLGTLSTRESHEFIAKPSRDQCRRNQSDNPREDRRDRGAPSLFHDRNADLLLQRLLEQIRSHPTRQILCASKAGKRRSRYQKRRRDQHGS